MAPTVNQCCCGCSLKTGSIIIGILGIVSATYGIIRNTVDVTAVHSKEDQNEEVRTADRIADIITIIILVIELVLSIMLVYGSVKERAQFVKPWIYFSIACLLILIITNACLMILAFITAQWLEAVIILVVVVIVTALSGYCIVVVNSFHRLLTGEHRPMMPVQTV